MTHINDAYYQRSFNETLERLTPAAMRYLLAEQEFVISNLARTNNVVELGCGTGRLTKLIAPATGKVIALDYSKTQLNEAVKNVYVWRDKVTFVYGNARNPPIFAQDDMVVIGMNTLNSLDDPSEESQLEVLASSRELLAPGGKLIFTVWGTNAISVQLLWYETVSGGNITYSTVDVDCIHIRNAEGVDLKVRRPSQEKLEEMLIKTGFENVKFEQITEYNLGCIATKKG